MTVLPFPSTVTYSDKLFLFEDWVRFEIFLELLITKAETSRNSFFLQSCTGFSPLCYVIVITTAKTYFFLKFDEIIKRRLMSLPAAKKMWRKLVLLSCCLVVASGGNTYVLRGNFTVPAPIVVSFFVQWHEILFVRFSSVFNSYIHT
jgi:hypothetical protein